MSWFYAVNDQQIGPVSEAEFAQLVGSGVIRPDTLVWREGMADWKRWDAVAAEQVSSPAPATGPAAPVAVAATEGAAGWPPANARPLAIEFTGQGGEYFRIWIVNVLLTIVTLGIYAAWAKVRTRRYFYGNTSLAGHAFEYLAEPKRILIGNLIVAAGFILFQASAAISPILHAALLLVIAAAVPWFIAKSILFNARNSAWRGLRFGFKGGYGGALVVYVLLPLLVPFTFGLIWPYVAKRRREWQVENHRYGTAPFCFSGQTGDFYVIYLKTFLFFLPLLAAYGLMISTAIGAAMAGRNGGDPAEAGAAMAGMAAGAGLLFFGGFLSAFVGAAYLRARMFTYAWNNTGIGPHRFAAGMRARDLLGLQIVNFLLTALTFGLAWPWVAVRTARFQLASLSVIPGGSLDAFVGEAQPEPGAVSEAAGDFLDFDVGFGV